VTVMHQSVVIVDYQQIWNCCARRPISSPTEKILELILVYIMAIKEWIDSVMHHRSTSGPGVQYKCTSYCYCYYNWYQKSS